MSGVVLGRLGTLISKPGTLRGSVLPQFSEYAKRVSVEHYYPGIGWLPCTLQFVSRWTMGNGVQVEMYAFYSSKLTGNIECLMLVTKDTEQNCWGIEVARFTTLSVNIYIDGVQKKLWEGLPTQDGVSGEGFYLWILPF